MFGIFWSGFGLNASSRLMASEVMPVWIGLNAGIVGLGMTIGGANGNPLPLSFIVPKW